MPLARTCRIHPSPNTASRHPYAAHAPVHTCPPSGSGLPLRSRWSYRVLFSEYWTHGHLDTAPSSFHPSPRNEGHWHTHQHDTQHVPTSPQHPNRPWLHPLSPFKSYGLLSAFLLPWTIVIPGLAAGWVCCGWYPGWRPFSIKPLSDIMERGSCSREEKGQPVPVFMDGPSRRRRSIACAKTMSPCPCPPRLKREAGVSNGNHGEHAIVGADAESRRYLSEKRHGLWSKGGS